MRVLIIKKYTGPRATNPKIAKRLNGKLRAAQSMGHCTLLEWQGVDIIEPEFIRLLTSTLKPEKVHLGGLTEPYKAQVPESFELTPVENQRSTAT